MKISQQQFEYVSTLAKNTSAQIIAPNKAYLIENRLGPIAREHGFDSIAALIDHLRAQSDHSVIHDSVIEALTTNETYFFRDFHPFEALEKSVIPRFLETKKDRKELRVWSAACSTGQEAYSFAMLLREKFPALANWKIKIIGTDLNNRVLEQARSGTYSQLEVNRGLPVAYLAKYFSHNGTDWEISPKIRDMVEFSQLNLTSVWNDLPVFDIVLLRNVLIYFDVATKRNILKSVRQHMYEGSILFLGAAETTISIDPNWEIENSGRTVYYKKTASA